MKKDCLCYQGLNEEYFDLLLEKYKNAQKDLNFAHIHPVSVASSDLLQELPYANYEDLKIDKKELLALAKSATLWIKKMQAGVGSSISRTTYLAKKRGLTPEKIKLGCKGTDLFAEIDGKDVSIAELQLLQAIYDAEQGFYSKVVMQDIVSDETMASIRDLWNLKCFFESNRTYEDIFSNNKKLGKFGEICQKHQATIDAKGELSTNRTSPGGHGLIGISALRACYKENERPNKNVENLIGVVGNGEDLGSSPDPLIVGWMIKNKVPVAMITTEKTELDMKGGQIALVDDGSGTVYITIIEKAQAENAGKLDLFEQMGLRPGDRPAFFNTNTAVFNYQELTPIVNELIQKMGENEFMRAVSPDLIKNTKKQVDKDGVERVYVQLEGAMGSSLLNFDKLCRQKLGKKAVHFLNIEKKNRTRFFTPIKTAFDFLLQFHSDVFSLDVQTMRLNNNHISGVLPAVTLKDKYYDDVENVLTSFSGTKMSHLEKLYIQGKARLCGAELVGDVEIVNTKNDIYDIQGRVENKKIRR